MSPEIIPPFEENRHLATLGSVDATSQAPRSSPAGHCLWLIRRGVWSILAIVVACVAITAGVSTMVTKRYDATATVDIDLGMPAGILGSEARQVSMIDTDQFMATQVKLIQSDSVVRSVADRFHLLEIEKQNREWLNASAAVRENAPIQLKKLTVNRPPNTFLIQISYRSPDPALSADVANAIADSYVRHVFELRVQAARGLSEFTERQLEQLKARMERSSDRVAQFERELTVINPEEKTSILSARLIQLNTEYTAAQADRLRKEAAAESLKSRSLDAAGASSQGEDLRRLSERLNQAQERFAQVQTQFGPRHPDYKKAESDVLVLQGQILRARDSIAARLEVEHREAVNREGMLARAVADVKAEFDQLNAKSFAYQTLKREAESDKKLHDELFRKVQEAGINAGFQNSAVRIADLARPPVKPSSPDLLFNLILAFCLSTLAAVGALVVLDERNGTIVDPQQASLDFRLRVLGVLPLVQRKWATRDPAVALKALGRASISECMFREGVHSLVNTISLTTRTHKLRSIALTSSLPAEGKTTVAFHLALANAERGRKTLLIDADFRRPEIHHRFGNKFQLGLNDALLAQRPWKEFLFHIDGLPLDVLSAGTEPSGAAHLLGDAVKEVVQEASSIYDLVIVDSPPILGLPEPLEIASCVDGTLVIALAGKTPRKILAQSIQTLRNLHVPYIGLVLNGVSSRTTEDHYYSRYAKYYGRYVARKSA